MFKALIVDQVVRKMISIIYRICLIAYSIFILSNNLNVFPWYAYIVIIIVYTFCFAFLYDKRDWKSKIRVLCDYVLIVCILYGKSLTISNYLLLIVPIFNAPNHSGERRSIILYLFLVGSVLFLKSWKLSFVDVAPLLIFFILERLERLRSRAIRFNSYMYETIDEFYIKYLHLNKSHLLYKELIEKLNNSKFRRLFTVKSIVCFIVRDNGLIVVNGSFFIWTYDIVLDTDEIKKLKSSIIENKKFHLNEKLESNNFLISVETKGLTYVYAINYEKKGLFFALSSFYVNVFLRPLLYKTAVTLLVEREIKFARDTNIKKIKSKTLYVNNATLAMHFLRNKFSPIKGFFDTLDLYEREVNQEKKLVLESFMDKNKAKVKNSIKEILQRTTFILEKSENPFVITDFAELSLKKIFHISRKIWIEYFDSHEIELNWENAEDIEQKFALSEEYLEILFTDITENMHRYNNGMDRLVFDEDSSYYYIKFENNFKSDQQEEIVKVCESLMSEDSEEINKRTTHGLTMIKSFLKQMHILYEAKILENNILSLTLFLKKN